MGLQKYRADKAGDITANGAQPFYANWMGGPTLALIRNCPIETKGVSIPPRTVYVRGEPDTAFSLAATGSTSSSPMTVNSEPCPSQEGLPHAHARVCVRMR
jgi:hypothetical protein